MLRTQSLHSLEDLTAITGEWSALHASARPGSAFEHPAWARTWAEHFLVDGALECVTVRDTDQDDALVGFAPMYRHRRSAGVLKAVSVQPLGTGRRQALTEVVQVLCAPERSPDVARAVVAHLEALPGWNWLQVSLGPRQGWLVPQWLEHRSDYMISHRTVRPCVLVELPREEGELLGQLKHNVRESVRRGRNRTRKLGDVSFRSVTAEPQLVTALQSLAGLHRKRSDVPGKTAHVDVLADDRERRFLVAAVRALAQHGLARVHLAAHEGRDVAALLVLSDGHTDYVSLSGLDPRYWDLNLNTLLIFEALLSATRSGRAAVNLSTGPDVAKLRWGTRLDLYHDFMVVRGDRRSRLLYGGYAHATLALRHRQEQRRHQVHQPGRRGPEPAYGSL